MLSVVTVDMVVKIEILLKIIKGNMGLKLEDCNTDYKILQIL